MTWVKDLYRDEIRSGFLVTAHRKRVWEIELEMLAELERICEKYGLHAFAAWGTLLGAVRHGGFIPWDDDIDLVMLRPEYERLKEVAPREFSAPYFFQTAYTDGGFFAMARIRCNGTMGMVPEVDYFHQGIFIDIHPLDAVPDGSARMEAIRAYQMELYALTMEEAKYRHLVAAGAKLVIGAEERAHILAMPLRQRLRLYEDFQIAHFDDSQRVHYYSQEFYPTRMMLYKADLARPVRLPFEETTVLAGAGYEKTLQDFFGADWRKFIRGASDHEGTIFSPDVSYEVFQAAWKKRHARVQ